MPDSVLDAKLPADRLVSVVDRIHERVHGRMGTRPYSVTVVTRRWSGEKTGEGTPSDSLMPILPPPEVTRGGTNRLGPAGQEGNNSVTLREVSFRYTEDELYPSKPANTEVVYMLERTFGGDPNTKRQEFFVVENSPTPERGDKAGDRIGWNIKLHEVQGFTPPDHTDA
jgi:hypothetical protein